MKLITTLAVFISLAPFTVTPAQVAEVSFKGAAGLQLYSLREQAKVRGVPWMLDQVKGFGIKEVELAGTGNLNADPTRAQKVQGT